MLVSIWSDARAGNYARCSCHANGKHRVRQAVQNQQEMEKLIEELSDLEWKRLRERKE